MTAPAATTVELGSLLYMKPSPAGGRLCVTGSGVAVRIVIHWYNQGRTPQEIADDYASLTLAGVHAAIAFYLANKSNLDAQWEAEERQGEEDKAYYEKHGKLHPRHG